MLTTIACSPACVRVCGPEVSSALPFTLLPPFPLLFFLSVSTTLVRDAAWMAGQTSRTSSVA